MAILQSYSISLIKSLRSEGLSFKQIAKQLSLSPATVYKYAKNVVLSDAAKNKIKLVEETSRINFISKFAVQKQITLSHLDAFKSRLLGHLFFDGHVYAEGKWKLGYTNASMAAIAFFVECVRSVYGLTENYIYQKTGVNVKVYTVDFYSKNACQDLFSFSNSFSTKQEIGIPKEILNGNETIRSSFLKAFWNDEGSVSCNGNVTGGSKSKRMIFDLKDLHKSLGVECTNYVDNKTCVNILRIRKNSLIHFSQKIGFDYSIITKGKNIGRLKKDVLNEIIMRKMSAGGFEPPTSSL